MRIADPYASAAMGWIALLISGGLHAGVVLGVVSHYAVPSLDIEFTIPTEVEFGLTDETSATLGGPTSPALPTQEAQNSAEKLAAEERAQIEEERQRESRGRKEAS